MMTSTSYWLSQSARVGLFLTQYLVSARLSRPAGGSGGGSGGGPRRARRSAPSLRQLLRDLGQLLIEDWQNIQYGLYRLPRHGMEDPRIFLGRLRRYFDDLPRVNERRRRGGVDEVTTERHGLPEYYLRNFHFQSDGYLSRRSAELYDHQVEVLFLGGADVMRRQALVPLGAYLRRRGGRLPVLVDVGCGTGRFLAAVGDNFPAVRAVGLDLSRPYLAEAERYLGPRSATAFIEGLAERMPLADASADVMSCVYLLHEVPAAVRAAIFDEMARVLRPGGRLIIVDSLQYGDRPAYDPLLEAFPARFHEPFYGDYAGSDLGAMLSQRGFRSRALRLAFFSKIMVFDKDA